MASVGKRVNFFASETVPISKRAAPVRKRDGISRGKGVCHGLVAYPLNVSVGTRGCSRIEGAGNGIYASWRLFGLRKQAAMVLEMRGATFARGGAICM